jgi:hypothetical protein
MATFFAFGESPRNISNRLPTSSNDPELMPARLEPELLKLLTNICGLPAPKNKMGMLSRSLALAATKSRWSM